MNVADFAAKYKSKRGKCSDETVEGSNFDKGVFTPSMQDPFKNSIMDINSIPWLGPSIF